MGSERNARMFRRVAKPHIIAGAKEQPEKADPKFWRDAWRGMSHRERGRFRRTARLRFRSTEAK